MHLSVDYFVTVNRTTTMVTYDAGLISGLLVCISRSQSSQGRLYLVDNTSCQSWEEKHSNIILNKDAQVSNQPVYIDLNSSIV